MQTITNSPIKILLFDGVCNLCNDLVQFLIKRDHQKDFKFASLQSKAGQSLLKKHGLSKSALNSFVYINENQSFIKSSAILQVLKELGGFYKVFYIFIIIPRPIRDFLYSMMAKSRYTIFGKRDQCMIPSSDTKDRFLEDEVN